MVELARASNPALRIIARAHSDEEVDYLTKLGADVVIMGEREIAHGMIAALDVPAATGGIEPDLHFEPGRTIS
ncbi:NAD-binding protein [Taklimakanibacter deserti]|uniref:NAD-binding protein n=1 Tax=Taklimakanibacter deserti TaxID=2267839 RepID=UPI003F688DDE